MTLCGSGFVIIMQAQRFGRDRESTPEHEKLHQSLRWATDFA